MAKYELPKLPYAYDAFEPFIDARTMEIHHSKHHATYVAKLNEALLKEPSVAEKPLEELLSNLSLVPESIRKAIQNHGGGHFNHSMFWKIMGPVGSVSKEPSSSLGDAIKSTFGDFGKFKETFSNSAATLFGSGWTWLIKDQSGKLKVITTQNQDAPLSQGLKPIMGLDIWEHAYYLKYQNRRMEYIEAWWNVVNWAEAEKNFGA